MERKNNVEVGYKLEYVVLFHTPLKSQHRIQNFLFLRKFTYSCKKVQKVCVTLVRAGNSLHKVNLAAHSYPKLTLGKGIRILQYMSGHS